MCGQCLALDGGLGRGLLVTQGGKWRVLDDALYEELETEILDGGDGLHQNQSWT